MNYVVKPPYLLRRLYSSLTWNVPLSEKIIYLTFDDGPIPEVTPFVLNELKQYNATATFFCIGENVAKHPSIYENIKAAGHATGNHTYNHISGWRTKDELYFKNIEQAADLIHSKLFRPPYGRIKKSQIKHLVSRYSIIMWDVLSYDYDKDVLPEKCLSNVINNTTAGSIVVFHDSLKAERNIKRILPQILEHFSEKGFEFRSI